jgi:hypothetical protein
MVSSYGRIVSPPPPDETVLQEVQLFQLNALVEQDFFGATGVAGIEAQAAFYPFSAGDMQLSWAVARYGAISAKDISRGRWQLQCWQAIPAPETRPADD